MAGALSLAALVGCIGAPASTSTTSPGAGHAVHDPALDALVTALAAEGLAWEDAGPHHLLGIGADDVEVDLVGVPLEQAVVSVPTEGRGDETDLLRRYLPPVGAALGASREADAWIESQLRGWDGRSPLRADARFGDAEVHLRSTERPAYVVVTITAR